MCLVTIHGVWIGKWIYCTYNSGITSNCNAARIIITHTSLLGLLQPPLVVAWSQSSNKGYSSCPYGSWTALPHGWLKIPRITSLDCPSTGPCYTASGWTTQKTWLPTNVLLLLCDVTAVVERHLLRHRLATSDVLWLCGVVYSIAVSQNWLPLTFSMLEHLFTW